VQNRTPAGAQALGQRRQADAGAECARQVRDAAVGAQHEARRSRQAGACTSVELSMG